MITLSSKNGEIEQSAILELGDVLEQFLDIHGSLDNGGGLDGLALHILANGYQKV